MKKVKNVVKVIVFLVLLLGQVMFLSLLFVPKNNLAEFGMDQVSANGILGEKDNSIDVVILGDSESYTSISPMLMWEQYGFTSYVCGTPGQRLYDSYTFLENTLEKQKPKIVILETNAIYRKQSLVNSILANWKRVFPILKYHNRWKSLTINDITGNVNYTWTDDNKGFKSNTRVRPTKSHDYMKKNKVKKEITKINARYVEKIARLCSENGIKFMLVSTPSIVNWNYDKHNGIAQLAALLEIEYLDINLASDLEIIWEKETQDEGDHLNYYGAIKVSNYLGNYLNNMKMLDDHREDEDYNKWHESLERYKKTRR